MGWLLHDVDLSKARNNSDRATVAALYERRLFPGINEMPAVIDRRYRSDCRHIRGRRLENVSPPLNLHQYNAAKLLFITFPKLFLDDSVMLMDTMSHDEQTPDSGLAD